MDIQTEPLPEAQKAEPPAAPIQTDTVSHLAIADRFNIQNPSKEEDGKLREIWDYAFAHSKSKEIPDVIWAVISLENTLGTPRLGESRLDRLYRYTKIKRQISMMENELRGIAGV